MTSPSVDVLPDTLQVLFVGSPRCGKKSLIWKLTHLDTFNDEYHEEEDDNEHNISHVKTRYNIDDSVVNESRNTNDYTIDDNIGDGDGDFSVNNDMSCISHQSKSELSTSISQEGRQKYEHHHHSHHQNYLSRNKNLVDKSNTQT